MRIISEELRPVDTLVYRVLLGFIIAVFLATLGLMNLGAYLDSPALVSIGVKVLDAFVLDERAMDGQVWRLVSHMWLHGSGLHIFFNLLVLNVFFSPLRSRLPNLRWLVVYIVAGIAGGALHLAFAPEIPIVGASGGVLGLWAATIALAGRTMLLPVADRPWDARGVLKQLGFMLLLNIGLWSVIPNIAHFAHGGGFAAGILLGLLLPYYQLPRLLVSRRAAFRVSNQLGIKVDDKFILVSADVEPSEDFDEGTDYLTLEHRIRSATNQLSTTLEPVLGEIADGEPEVLS